MKTTLLLALLAPALALGQTNTDIAPLFRPPTEFQNQFGKYKSLLVFDDGRPVRTAADWKQRRTEILAYWEKEIGHWPPLLENPSLEYLSSTRRENFLQHRVRMQIAPEATAEGYLLVPNGEGPFPAAVIPYYEPDSSVGLGEVKLRDFGYQLTRRGFVTISIGSPGGDARKPDTAGVPIQPLHFLGYIAANCRSALSKLPAVDANRIGIVGHSYGGKWALFAAAFDEKFACAAWSDPGSVFDETRPNVNYWEPWYLGQDEKFARKSGLPSETNPRTGPYKRIYESGRDLHEVIALIAPRPFFVSGGSEDPPERWQALNRVNEVYSLLGAPDRIAMSTRPHHSPTPESNEQIYLFFQRFLK